MIFVDSFRFVCYDLPMDKEAMQLYIDYKERLEKRRLRRCLIVLGALVVVGIVGVVVARLLFV